MNYYQELSILPSSDIGMYFLWQKVYQQIHLALVENKNKESAAIGIGFPEYNTEKCYVGKKLRLFANEEISLINLHCDRWLHLLINYVHLSQIKPVKEKLDGFACFKHIKSKGNKEKLARRRVKRKGETLMQALSHFEDFEEQRITLPYINIRSMTNGHRFRLYIKKQVVEQPQSGLYSCYGLSNTATVPLF